NVAIDDVIVASCAGTPCSYQWDTTLVSDGAHTVSASALSTSTRGWRRNSPQTVTASVVVMVANTTSSTPPSTSPPPPPAPPAPITSTTTSVVDLLTGPLTLLGVPNTTLGNQYDNLQLTQGAIYAANFPTSPTCIMCSDYYDLALTFYLIYYRTGDPSWLSAARTVAVAWRDSPNNAAIAQVLGGDWSAGSLVPPPRSMATL